jgi:NAD(P)-dependent dehydrogenase (short-subunit alcohol dehydrogenase family)
MQEFDGRAAVVTGASSGIGAAIARRCAREGMALALADVDESGLEALRKELEEGGTRCIAVPTDVSRSEAVAALAERAFSELGGVHLLFNNAGVVVSGLSWERTEDDYRWVLGVNLWGVIHGIHAFVPRMIAQGQPAHIVNTASIAGLSAGPMLGSYTASKHAVVGLTETLHHELAMIQSPIRVSCLCPGGVATGIMEAERNRPSELAGSAPRNPMETAMEETLKSGIPTSMPPDELAELVFEAIRAERFWILTHPEFAPIFEKRFRTMMEGGTPDRTGTDLKVDEIP